MNQAPYNNYYNNGTYYNPRPQMSPQMQQQYARQHQIDSMRSKEKGEILTTGIALGAAIIVSLIIQVIGVQALSVLGLYDDFNSSFMFQHSINILLVDVIALVLPFSFVALLLKKRFVTPIVPRSEVGFLKGAAWVFVGLAICLGANIITNIIINIFKEFGYELTKFDSLKPNHPLECVLLVFSTAVAPALCEEFAMRCVSLGALRKHGKPFAVIAVSIVFGLLHGNVIQFVFAFLIGLVLAYITIVTDSVVPAMFIHGCNNGLSVLQEILNYATTDKVNDYVISGLMIAILIFAALGFIYLLLTKQFLPKKEIKQPKPYKINFFVKLALLMPGLALPFVILIVLTAQTIVPIK